MDEIDKLKGAWKHQDYTAHHVSKDEIYRMLHRKSSSYVKWIFIISIVEFVLVNSLLLFRDVRKDLEMYDEMGINTILTIITVFSYAIVFYFMYLFYKNYKSIQTDSTAKALMERILKTRRTVKNYIYFNVGIIIITSSIMINSIFSSEENLKLYKMAAKVPQDFPKTTLLIVVIATMVIMIGVFLIVYRIIYGILLRRLKKNHKELEQLDK